MDSTHATCTFTPCDQPATHHYDWADLCDLHDLQWHYAEHDRSKWLSAWLLARRKHPGWGDVTREPTGEVL